MYREITNTFDALEIRKRGLYPVGEYAEIPELAPWIRAGFTGHHDNRWHPDVLRDGIADYLPAYSEMAPEAAVIAFVKSYVDAERHLRTANLQAHSPAMREVLAELEQKAYDTALSEVEGDDNAPAPWDSDYTPPEPPVCTHKGPSKPQARGIEPITTPGVLERIHAIKNAERRAALSLCYWAAMRVGEVVALKWSDVHLDTIYIRESKTGPRSTDNHAELNKVLNLLRTERGVVDLDARVIPRCRATVYRWCRAVTDESPHSLRHTRAMVVIEGKGYQTAADLLGHKSVDTTIRHYAKYHIGDLHGTLADI